MKYIKPEIRIKIFDGNIETVSSGTSAKAVYGTVSYNSLDTSSATGVDFVEYTQ